MSYDQFSDRMWDLLFGIRRSVRYHDRRAAFYERLHNYVAAFSLLLGSAALYGVYGQAQYADQITAAAALTVTVLNVLDLVFQFSKKANLHTNLKNRFCSLEGAVVIDPSDSQFEQYYRERLDIESCEPNVMRALDILCHNEICRAESIFEKVHQLGLWKRMTANIYSWADIAVSEPDKART